MHDNTKKLLIIGAGTEQISVIKEAKKMGHYVIVTDFNPQAPGIPFADQFELVSTTDGPGNVAIGKKENIDGVLTVCSETAVPTVAFVAEALNLPSFSQKTALLATNKSEMRKALVAHNVRVSSYIIASEFEACTHYFENNQGPWVIKPVDSSGQRGTSIVFERSELARAFQLAIENSYTGEALVDQFVTGPEVHVTMHVINGAVHYLAITDRVTLDKDNFGIAIRHVGPALLSDQVTADIKIQCERGIEAIELKNGIVTCEIILKEDIPFVMELAVRVPGGYLREVASILSGVNIDKTTIWTSLGENKPFTEIVTESIYPAISVKFLTASNLDSSIKTIAQPPNCKDLFTDDIRLINFHFDSNFKVPDLNSSVARFGAIIATGNSQKEAIYASEKVFESITISGKHLTDYSNYNPYNKDFK